MGVKFLCHWMSCFLSKSIPSSISIAVILAALKQVEVMDCNPEHLRYFFNSTQRYLGAIQFSNLPQTSLPWTNQCHQNESPRSHYLKFLTCSSKLQHLLFHFCKHVIKIECLKNSFGTKFKEIWWKVVSQLLIWYYPSLPYPSLEHCFEVGWHDEWNEVKMCQEVDPKMTHAF